MMKIDDAIVVMQLMMQKSVNIKGTVNSETTFLILF